MRALKGQKWARGIDPGWEFGGSGSSRGGQSGSVGPTWAGRARPRGQGIGGAGHDNKWASRKMSEIFGAGFLPEKRREKKEIPDFLFGHRLLVSIPKTYVRNFRENDICQQNFTTFFYFFF